MRKGKNKTELKEFTKEEVAKHNTKNDCYIIFNKMVFDVTDWQYLHPGGAEIMGKYGGTDCTADFKKQHPWINPLSLMGPKCVQALMVLSQMCMLWALIHAHTVRDMAF